MITFHPSTQICFATACALVLVSTLVCVQAAGAATYYVKKTGNDANSCAAAQSESTPKLTIGSGLGCLKAGNGDVLDIGAGTYAESINSVVDGTSYTNAATIRAHTGDTVILRPGGGFRAMTLSNHRYIIFDSIIFDGTGVSYDAVKLDTGSDHIRLANCEARNAVNQGILIAESSFMEIINTSSHDNGRSSLEHGIYIGHSSDNLVRGGEFYNNSGYGIQMASGGPTRNTIDGVRTHNNGRGGIVSADGPANTLRNNVAYSNPVGIELLSASYNKIYNNTFYQNGTGLVCDGSGHIVKNNISYGNNNNGMCGSDLSNNITSDPSFVNAGAFDFHLRPNSVAKDAGVTLSEVTNDIDGVRRPQGGNYDVGAYEYAGAVDAIPPEAPTGVQVQ